jgi:U3 small nucleolar RNA-associated protein 20
LRPLWSPATAAISSLSSRFGDLVWELLFTDLKRVNDPVRGSLEGGGNHGLGHVDEREDEDVWEEERSWRDPSAHKLRVAVAHWMDEDYHRRQYVKVCPFGSFAGIFFLMFSAEPPIVGTFRPSIL